MSEKLASLLKSLLQNIESKIRNVFSPVPVAPMMTRGCPLNAAKMIPETEVVIRVSEIPISPPEIDFT